MIKKPTQSPVIAFEDNSSKEHSIKATTLSHLYGEATSAARVLEGIQGTDAPKSITIYDCFRTKIAESLTIDREKLSEETIFLVAQEMERHMEMLKKTCIVTGNSAS